MSTAAAVPAEIVMPARRPGYGTAWWGMVTLIMTEAMIFGGLLASNFFLRAAAKQWPPPGIELPELPQTIVFSIVLWLSSAPIVWAEHAMKRGRMGAVRAGLMLSFLMGAAFMYHTVDDFQKLHFGWRGSAYGSIYYTTIGLHAIHVVVGLLMNLVVQLKARLGRLSPERHVTLQVFGLYWHFVDAVWVFVFLSLIVSPHIR